MSRSCYGFLTILVAFFVLWAGPAQAQVANPGFETGTLASWTVSGNASVIGTLGPPGVPVPPDSGSFQAFLRSQPGSTPIIALEAFLGLTPGAISTLDVVALPATQGSAIKQTITVTAGTTLTLRYNFLTTETPIPNTFANDLCFFAVIGPGATLKRLANTASPLVPGPNPYNPSTNPGDGMTGYQTFTHTFTASGSVTLGLGVVDMSDTLWGSAVLFDTIGGGGGGGGQSGGTEGSFAGSSGPSGLEGSFGFGGFGRSRLSLPQNRPPSSLLGPFLKKPAGGYAALSPGQNPLAGGNWLVFNGSHRQPNARPALEPQHLDIHLLSWTFFAGLAVGFGVFLAWKQYS